MGSSHGASTQVVQYVPVETASQEPIVQPAVAKNVSRGTEGALAAQQNERAKRFGIGRTYADLAMKREGGNAGGNATLGGN